MALRFVPILARASSHAQWCSNSKGRWETPPTRKKVRSDSLCCVDVMSVSILLWSFHFCTHVHTWCFVRFGVSL